MFSPSNVRVEPHPRPAAFRAIKIARDETVGAAAEILPAVRRGGGVEIYARAEDAEIKP